MDVGLGIAGFVCIAMAAGHTGIGAAVVVAVLCWRAAA